MTPIIPGICEMVLVKPTSRPLWRGATSRIPAVLPASQLPPYFQAQFASLRPDEKILSGD
jgi:hypothetical protein